ncbi:MAG: hypothetical protein BGN88_07935 [Clostridiales bacterium 43-6]|nr:MAG: hypothetical protein BGN88_07935 [Clostridiales bacterium 43-6]
MLLKLLFVLIGSIISVSLFKKASTTLSLAKLNVISYIFYMFVMQTLIGGALVFLGDTGHYTFKYLTDFKSIDIMFISVMATAILLPMTIVLIYKICNINMKERYQNYLDSEVTIESEQIVFLFISAISFICLTLLLILLYKIGYIPAIKLIRAEAGFNFGTERIKISGLSVINNYVKNILILSFIPVMSYVAFVFALITKKSRWILLFVVLFCASVIVKTYNFEKSQVIFYLFVYLIIYTYVKGRISKKLIVSFMTVALVFILLIYYQMGYSLSFSKDDLYNGPIGRTIFTQVGTLTYNFDLFPSIFGFLNGRSLPNILLTLFHIDGDQLRSAKLLMEYYGSTHVFEGTGGVMNSLFIGESYANFGFIGMFFSIFYMGGLLSFFMWIFTKIKKNAIYIVLFAILTSKITLTIHGGFMDFIYNFDAIIITVLLVGIKLSASFYPKLQQMILKKKSSEGNS